MMAKESEQPKAKPTCFVIMPISDSVGYETGHFGRVYEHLLKPAILAAGYNPVRADDTIKTDYIVVGIIQRIVDSDMVLCDISARNANVLYELGIRHAFNKPVVLIKDKKTEKIFDIQGLRYAEYDETLRIDVAAKDTLKITNAITETAQSTSKDTNSIVHLAGIRAAEVPAAQTISPDTQLILTAINDIGVFVGRPNRPLFTSYRIDDNVYVNNEFIGKVESVDTKSGHIIVESGKGERYLYDINSTGFKDVEFRRG
jgi:hypothetical protein